MKKPYFRIIDFGDLEGAKSWFEYFKARGIPCAIVSRKTKKGYSCGVYRAGIEITLPGRKKQDDPLNRIRPGMVIEEVFKWD